MPSETVYSQYQNCIKTVTSETKYSYYYTRRAEVFSKAKAVLKYAFQFITNHKFASFQ